MADQPSQPACPVHVKSDHLFSTWKIKGQSLWREHTGVNVHSYIVEIELDQSVVDALQIGTFSIGAFSHIQVSDKVSETVGLYVKLAEQLTFA